jgi:phospholipid/cholesterol/gamma-HCH transport system substrate-binding protein
METKEVAQQVKLGAFVLAGVALFLVSVFFIGSENNIFSRTFNVAAVFKNVEGLKEGDNVWLSGVKIGTVTDVEIVSQGQVIVSLSLKHNQHQFITEDATASVGSDGLVGNKIVVIRPGKSQAMIDDGDTINTNSPTDTQELFNIAKDVGDNTRSLTGDLKLIAQKINNGQGIVGELLNDGEVAQDLRLAVANLKTTSNNTARLSSELHHLVAQMRTGDGLLPSLISDTTYAQSFTKALRNVEDVSAHANVVAKNLEVVANRMNDRDNALGVLLQDSTFAMRLRNTMQNTEQATNKLDENMEAMRHNFLFRGYFKKQDKKKSREQEAGSSKGNVSARK